MKVKTCTQCRKEIYEEVKKEYLKLQYRWFDDAMTSAMQHSMCAVVAVMEKRGLSKKYIKKFFDECCFFFDMPEVFGKQIYAKDLKKRFEKDYDVDFSKIVVHMESENEFVKENA